MNNIKEKIQDIEESLQTIFDDKQLSKRTARESIFMLSFIAVIAISLCTSIVAEWGLSTLVEPMPLYTIITMSTLGGLFVGKFNKSRQNLKSYNMLEKHLINEKKSFEDELEKQKEMSIKKETVKDLEKSKDSLNTASKTSITEKPFMNINELEMFANKEPLEITEEKHVQKVKKKLK